MSDKNKIREMVMALAKGDRELAEKAFKQVAESKSKSLVSDLLESDEELEEGHGMMRAGRRHMRAGGRHMRSGARHMNREKMHREKMHGKMHERRGDEYDDDYDDAGVDPRKMRSKRDVGRMRKLKKRRMSESNDTHSDSGVMKGKYDQGMHDVTARKGGVKDNKDIDHKDYTHEKPNVYKKKDARSGKPVNEGDKRDVVDWSDVRTAAMKTAKKVHGNDVKPSKVDGIIDNAKKHKPDSTKAAVELVQDMLRKKED
jgi:hypothetical protein